MALDPEQSPQITVALPVARDSSASYGTFSDESSEQKEGGMVWKCCSCMLAILERYKSCFFTMYVVILTNCLALGVLFLFCKVKNWQPPTIFHKFMPFNDWYFQLANIFLILSYTVRDLLHLRICLFFGCSFFALFGTFGLPGFAVDCILWNCIMSLINAYYIVELAWKWRHIPFTTPFEQVYLKVFKPIGMTRHDFNILQSFGVLRTERKGVPMHHIGDDITSLCILVSGKVQLQSLKEKVLTTYKANDILEAIEWLHGKLTSAREPDRVQTHYQHKYLVTQDVKYIKFSHESIVKLIKTHPRMKQLLQTALGLNAAHAMGHRLRQVGDALIYHN